MFNLFKSKKQKWVVELYRNGVMYHSVVIEAKTRDNARSIVASPNLHSDLSVTTKAFPYIEK